MRFEAGIKDGAGSQQDALIFVFRRGRLLIRRSAAGIEIPADNDFRRLGLAPERRFYFGALDGRACHAASLQSAGALADSFEWADLRSLFGVLDEELIWVAGRANQLIDWDQSHRFCGSCATATEDKSDERAKRCPACGLVNYPRLSPAVIVAVLNGDRILLARNQRFKVPMFSVLAGFVEPGETLEACIEREVREEVGVAVRNIRYFGSQPWPFPNSLMIAFTAEYAGGEIRIDGGEIAEAGWFARSDLPPVPSSISIARRLIDWFVGTV